MCHIIIIIIIIIMLGSEVLAVILMVLGLLLLLHHGWRHSYDAPESNARRESCEAACFFQVPDVRNHETWIIVCITNALSLWAIGPCLGKMNV